MARGKLVTNEEITDVINGLEVDASTVNRVRNKLYRDANNIPGNLTPEHISAAQELFLEFRNVRGVRNRPTTFKVNFVGVEDTSDTSNPEVDIESVGSNVNE